MFLLSEDVLQYLSEFIDSPVDFTKFRATCRTVYSVLPDAFFIRNENQLLALFDTISSTSVTTLGRISLTCNPSVAVWYDFLYWSVRRKDFRVAASIIANMDDVERSDLFETGSVKIADVPTICVLGGYHRFAYEFLVESFVDWWDSCLIQSYPHSVVDSCASCSTDTLLVEALNATRWMEEGFYTRILFKACRRGLAKSVAMLVKFGADVRSISEGTSPMLEAIASRDVEAVITLYKAGSQIAPSYRFGVPSPLNLACRTVNLEMVMVLLALGADVNARDFFGATALQQTRNMKHDLLRSELFRNSHAHVDIELIERVLFLANAKYYKWSLLLILSCMKNIIFHGIPIQT